MVDMKGLTIAGERVIMGGYYHEGVYKEMNFGDMMACLLEDKPLPKTFEKYHSLEPLCQVNGFAIVPGHLDMSANKQV